MIFLHTGDLHLGKTVNDFSMIEDQRMILRQLAAMALKERVDAVVLAGDIYDRAIPPAEAVLLFNDFLTGMVKEKIPVLLIGGNHDSPERLGFADEILNDHGIHISSAYHGELKKIIFRDHYGEVAFFLMPFVKAAAVGEKTSGEAAARILESCGERNDYERTVLTAHCFVTNEGKEPELSDAETTIHVGGLDNVEAGLFDSFDYVALGHIHRAQRIGEKNIYYSGAPLAYSFSEAGMTKTVNIVELKEKGNMTVRKETLQPLHGLRKIKGRIEELMRPEIVEAADSTDYIQAALTNEEELIDPIGTLRTVYPNIMQIILTKNEIQGQAAYESKAEERRKTIPELFEGFYEIIRSEKPDAERMEWIIEAAKEAEGGGNL